MVFNSVVVTEHSVLEWEAKEGFLVEESRYSGDRKNSGQLE